METKIIRSFGEYVEYTNKYKGNCYFRGQADSEWDITPTISRGNAPFSLEHEKLHIIELLKQNENKRSFNRIPKPLGALFQLQHYHTATRICDLTISNLSALFFASEQEDNKDGAVYILDMKNAVRSDSLEMQLFSEVLLGADKFPNIENLPVSIADLENIVKRNYIVEYKEMLYNNMRSPLQGGTGIVFGFGIEANKLKLLGNKDISNFIVGKTIIPKDAKKGIMEELNKLGYIKEILYDNSEGREFEEINFVQKEFEVNQIFDGCRISKINAKYQISSLHVNTDELVGKITSLYNGLFTKYGNNSRIWTFFYYDDNDLANYNWICRGEWHKEYGYSIRMTKDYFLNRLIRMNSEISSEDAVEKASNLVERAKPFYSKLKEYVSHPEYKFDGLLSMALEMQAELKAMSFEAGDFPNTDFYAQKFTDKALAFVHDVYGIIEHTIMHSSYTNQNEVTKKWGMKWNFNQCRESYSAFIEAENQISHKMVKGQYN